eukprot:scaffold4355_cov81-Skeletonema_dohrnii-CCMP3373.AAC.3
MNADLIVDFHVHFSKTAQLHIFNVQTLLVVSFSFYTSSEYDLMKLVVRGDDVLAARAARTSRGVVDDDVSTKEKASVCFIGIEHLLTSACTDEVRACRARCIRAVLTEQARARSASATRFGWETIALAPFAQTRKAALGGWRQLSGKARSNLFRYAS